MLHVFTQLSCLSFIRAVSYSYPMAYTEMAEGAPLNALSEVWPYILSCVLSLTSGKCETLKLSVFTGVLSIPLHGFQ